jgi:hypothetical protein
MFWPLLRVLTPSLKEAMKSPDKDKWMAACLEEICSHTENGSWKWVELPEGTSAIGSRWVFKVKGTEDGSIERYKARLVAQGFSQRPGWDFVENFAPTIRLSVIRAIFALVAAERTWSVTRLISLLPSLMENWRTPST